MSTKNRKSISEEAWELTKRQHGAVARRQLLALGFSAAQIRHRIERGRLHRIGTGVYAVGRRELTQHGLWMAAVLGAGPNAVLSHDSAAALWGIRPVRPPPVEVSLAVHSGRARPGIRLHHRPGLAPADLAVRDRIPVVGVVLTLIDIACDLRPGPLERAVNEADRLDLIDPESLAASLEQYPGRRGVGRLGRLLGRRTFRLSDSELERYFLPLAADAGLPVPLTRQYVNGFRVDFHWPELGLVVESDGLRYHRTPAQQARDRLRDQTHAAAGTQSLRFTHDQIAHDVPHVLRTLRAVAARLEGRGGGG